MNSEDLHPIHMKTQPIIGTTTQYHGDEHAYLRGYDVRIIAVLHRGNCELADGGEIPGYQYLTSDDDIARAGGVTAADRVDVQPDAVSQDRGRPPAGLGGAGRDCRDVRVRPEMSQQDFQKRQLIRWIQTNARCMTGRRYEIALERLDTTSLRSLQRLLRDLEYERRVAVRDARLRPWR